MSGHTLIQNQIVIMIGRKKYVEGFKKLFYRTQSDRRKKENAAEEKDR